MLNLDSLPTNVVPNPLYWDAPLIIDGWLVELSGCWRIARIVPNVDDCRLVRHSIDTGAMVRGYGVVITHKYVPFSH